MAGFSGARPAVLSIAKLLMVGVVNLPFLKAHPLSLPYGVLANDDEAPDATDPNLWLYLGIAVFLVLLGGVFAGLTIAYVSIPPIVLWSSC
jgi:metal transporter CNNM